MRAVILKFAAKAEQVDGLIILLYSLLLPRSMRFVLHRTYLHTTGVDYKFLAIEITSGKTDCFRMPLQPCMPPLHLRQSMAMRLQDSNCVLE